jgi:PKD repeat protein
MQIAVDVSITNLTNFELKPGDNAGILSWVLGPPVPVADFSADATSGDAPLTVNFTDLSTGSPTSWSWDFGDGNTSTDQNPTHIYTVAGVYTVTLIVTNETGAGTETKTDYITVLMVADFIGDPVSGSAPLTVKFEDQSIGVPTSWSWDFGDDNVSSNENPTHVYGSAGIYTVTLIASNISASDTETKTSYVTVAPFVPGAIITEDIAVPADFISSRFAILTGSAGAAFLENGIQLAIPSNAVAVQKSGFVRPSGPTLIFD